MYAFPMETPFLRSTRLKLHYAPVYINIKDRKKKKKKKKRKKKRRKRSVCIENQTKYALNIFWPKRPRVYNREADVSLAEAGRECHTDLNQVMRCCQTS